MSSTEQMRTDDPGGDDGSGGGGRLASGRHPVNVGHLVMGLALLGLVTVWALVRGDVVDSDDVRWFLPLPWVLAGAVGLVVTTVRPSRRGHAG